MTTRYVILLVYGCIGVFAGSWSLRRFHRRLDAKYPKTEPWHFEPIDSLYVLLFVVMWPVLCAIDEWSNNNILGKP